MWTLKVPISEYSRDSLWPREIGSHYIDFVVFTVVDVPFDKISTTRSVSRIDRNQKCIFSASKHNLTTVMLSIRHIFMVVSHYGFQLCREAIWGNRLGLLPHLLVQFSTGHLFIMFMAWLINMKYHALLVISQPRDFNRTVKRFWVQCVNKPPELDREYTLNP